MRALLKCDKPPTHVTSADSLQRLRSGGRRGWRLISHLLEQNAEFISLRSAYRTTAAIWGRFAKPKFCFR